MTSSIHKVLDILLLFSAEGQQHSIDTICQQTDMPISTAYRYVRVLCDKGLLERTGDGRYHLGLRFLELSRGAINSNRDLRLTVLPSVNYHPLKQVACP